MKNKLATRQVVSSTNAVGKATNYETNAGGQVRVAPVLSTPRDGSEAGANIRKQGIIQGRVSGQDRVRQGWRSNDAMRGVEAKRSSSGREGRDACHLAGRAIHTGRRTGLSRLRRNSVAEGLQGVQDLTRAHMPCRPQRQGVHTRATCKGGGGGGEENPLQGEMAGAGGVLSIRQ